MTNDSHVNTFIDAILDVTKAFAIIYGEFRKARFM